MAPNDETLGEWITRITEVITWPVMCQIAVKFMAFECETLETIWLNSVNVSELATREVLSRFKKQLDKEEDDIIKQRLRYYLINSGLVNQHDVEPILGKSEENESFECLPPKRARPISTQVLGELASKIAARKMMMVATGWLGLSFSDEEEAKYEGLGKSFLFNLAILNKYAKKPNSTLQDLKERLLSSAREGGHVDGGEITKILNKEINAVAALTKRSAEQQKEETKEDKQESPGHKPADHKQATSSRAGPSQVDGRVKSSANTFGGKGKTKYSAKQPLTGEKNEREGAFRTHTNIQDVEPKTDRGTWIKAGLGVSVIVVTISVLTITGSFSTDSQIDQQKGTASLQAPFYSMDTNPRGYVLIINNKVFHNDPGSSNTRHGTDNDVARLKQVFEKLDFGVEEKRDLTAADLRKEIKQFAQREEHDTASASVVVVLSHGRNGAITGTDGKEAQVDHLIGEFSSDNSRVLAGKPKLFLFQACRGEGLDYSKDALENEVEMHLEHITKMGQIIPRFADILVGYSTDPGLYSLRHPLVGSIFIQAFCDVVDEHAHTTDLLAITTMVNAKMADSKYRTGGENVAQMSEFISKLTKKWNLSNTPIYQHQHVEL